MIRIKSFQCAMVIVLAALLTACPSNEGPRETEDPELLFPDTVIEGKPVFVDVDQVFYGNATVELDGEEGGTSTQFSLLSFDTTLASDEPDVVVFDVDQDLIVELNLEDDDRQQSEVSVVVKNDSVYKIIQETGEVKVLKHFPDRICELIPAQRVETDFEAKTHTVLNEEWVYVKTASAAGTEDACASEETTKRYYQLALNYQFDADQNDDSATNLLPTVAESEARAQLVFGWVAANDQKFGWDEAVEIDAAADAYLGYGYLGLGFLERKLRFFDADRQEVWSQERNLQEFSQALNLQNETSPRYLTNLERLDETHYQLQLGRSVFVFDASQELFARAPLEADKALSDRTFFMEQKWIGGTETVEAVHSITDDEEVIYIDEFKIYRMNYQDGSYVPINPVSFDVKFENALSNDRVVYGEQKPFSQFDLRACSWFTDEAECNDANLPDAILNPEWQFVTDCTEAVDCEFVIPSGGVCATDEELLLDPTAGTRCTASNYQHLADLDTSDNNAEFRGYMQYGPEYIRSVTFAIREDTSGTKSLLLTPRFNTRELLLQYFYNESLSSPKADRESILLGERTEHQGLDAYLKDDNLFVTTLLPSGTRTNECYKNYQKVTCDLGELVDNGSLITCTGKDLLEGLCANSFREYEALALFCTEDQINSNGCTDNQILASRDIAVEAGNEDARWMPMYERGSDSPQMHLLISPDVLVTRDEEDGSGDLMPGVLDEGVLQSPTVMDIDYSLSEIQIYPLFTLPTQVEHVLQNAYLDGNESARIHVISEDAYQEGGKSIEEVRSVADTVFMSNNIAQRAAEQLIKRPVTRGYATESEDEAE